MSSHNSGSTAPQREAERRVIFVNRFYAPDQSATAQILTDLAEHLAGRGWSVEIITSRLFYGGASARLEPYAIVNGVVVRRVSTVNGVSLGLFGRLLAYLTFYVSASIALLQCARPETVIVAKTDPPLIGVFALGIGWLRRARLVNWLQDLYPEVAIQVGVPALRGPVGAVLSYFRDMSMRRAALNVAIGHRMAGRIATRGVSQERIATIANWTDDEAIQPAISHSLSLRKEWGLPSDAFVLQYSGNLGRAHEVETLLAASALLAKRHDIWFLFVGGGPAQVELRRRSMEAGRERFVFQPHQPRVRLSESLAVGNAHWLSLRPEFEGLIVPSKVFGIAAAARPIVAVCDLQGEIPQMILASDAGIAVAPGNASGLAAAIVSLADDRAACRAMGHRARIMLQQGFQRSLALAQWQERLEGLAAGG
jgi:glycosyltransferase involved in cell wall biosynthesis